MIYTWHSFTFHSQINPLSALLQISKTETNVSILVSNDFNAEFDFLAAFGCNKSVVVNSKNDFENMNHILKNKYWFGHLAYDFKNIIESIQSQYNDPFEFDLLNFCNPKVILKIKKFDILIYSENIQIANIYYQYFINKSLDLKLDNAVKLNLTLTKTDYINKVNQIKYHIQRGDIYLANFCMQYLNNNATINPYLKFYKLNVKVQSPFAVFYKNNDNYTLSASPERFVKKIYGKIFSQPIKGTRKLGNDENHNNEIKKELVSNKKEQNENIMTVDLVRNDLARIANKKTVRVSKLFDVQTFNTVHHLVSTVEADIPHGLSFEHIVKNIFPIPSVTGTPKYSATILMNKFENFNRGLYTGSIGYITDENNFDFNVVIRTIFYSESKKIISLAVGSAITNKCNPNDEFEECELKAKALLAILEND